MNASDLPAPGLSTGFSTDEVIIYGIPLQQTGVIAVAVLKGGSRYSENTKVKFRSAGTSHATHGEAIPIIDADWRHQADRGRQPRNLCRQRSHRSASRRYAARMRRPSPSQARCRPQDRQQPLEHRPRRHARRPQAQARGWSDGLHRPGGLRLCLRGPLLQFRQAAPDRLLDTRRAGRRSMGRSDADSTLPYPAIRTNGIKRGACAPTSASSRWASASGGWRTLILDANRPSRRPPNTYASEMQLAHRGGRLTNT